MGVAVGEIYCGRVLGVESGVSAVMSCVRVTWSSFLLWVWHWLESGSGL